MRDDLSGFFPLQVHLATLGCRLNEAEIQQWAREFHALGHQLVDHPEAADLVVLNTCAVTEEAVRKSRKLIRRAQRVNPRAKLVVSGCYSSLQPTETYSLPGVDLVISNSDKSQLVRSTLSALEWQTMPATANEPDASPLFARGRQRAFIKVQDGCRYRCTFCVVTLARGAEQSRAPEEVIAEVNQLYAEGIQEIVLAGVHLGGWGAGLGLRLSDLLQALLDETAMPRIRLGSLEPWDLPERLWALLSDPRVMPHLHLPIQSGSSSVLRRMSRRGSPEAYAALIQQGRALVPHLNITTDIIVGFPGETDDEHQATLDFVEQQRFGHLHIFSYSPRAGTRAATLMPPIPESVKRKRSQQLHHLSMRLREQSLHDACGATELVLVEGAAHGGIPDDAFGYTPHYLPVRIPGEAGRLVVGSIWPVQVYGVDLERGMLIGRPSDG